MNKKLLLHGMLYTKLAYRYPAHIREHLSGSIDTYIFDTTMDIQGYITYTEEDTLIIGFRGTNSFQDVLTDIKFWKKKIPYGNKNTRIRIHAGFMDAYYTVDLREIIHDYISKYYKCKKIIIVGHSMGAAIAVLCAVDIQYSWILFKRKITCIISGVPPIGNRAFRKSYDKRIPETYRIQNGDDPLSKFNFLCWLLNYTRPGKLIKIGKRHWWKFWGNWKDHRVYEYYANLVFSMKEKTVNEVKEDKE